MNFAINDNSRTCIFDNFSHFQNVITNNLPPASIIMMQCVQKSICDSPLKKRLKHKCFPVNLAKLLRTDFSQNFPGGCFCIFSKVIKQPFRKSVNANRFLKKYFFFSTLFKEAHRLMYKKSNSFVYKFFVNCQVF